MNQRTVGKIILAKVLEMPLSKYLAYIERITQERSNSSHREVALVKKSDRPRRPVRQNTATWRDHRVEAPGQVFGTVTIQRGKLCFRIHDDRLVKIFPTGHLTDDRMICSLNWINTRNTFALHIVNSLLQYQRRYWISGKDVHLRPLTFQKFLTMYPLRYLDQSRLSRLVPKLFVRTPHHEIINLKSLFPSPKRIYACRIKELIHSTERPLNDRQLQSLLAQEGIHLSHRTVCNCRKLLNIPNYKERAACYYGRDIAFSEYRKLSEKKFNRIPSEPGVYELSIAVKLNYARYKSDVIYVGSSRDLRKRIASYSGNGVKNDQLSHFLKQHEVFVRFSRTEHYRILERELLNNFKNNYGELPKCNSIGG
jgi:hypothetical protein